MQCPNKNSRHPMPMRLGCDMQNPGGFLGSYAPADRYVPPCATYGCSAATGSLNKVQMSGPCSAGYGLDSKQLFPAAISACDGFDQVLVSAPLDFLYADNLMNDVNVLTTTRNQSRDLRGEPAIQAVFTTNEQGQIEMGPFGGAQQSTMGPYELRKAVRTYVV